MFHRKAARTQRDLRPAPAPSFLEQLEPRVLLSSSVLSISENTPDRFEANGGNGGPQSATQLGTLTGDTFVGDLSIHDAADEDWFKFTITEPGEPGQQIKLFFDNASGDIDAKIFDDLQQPAIRSGNSSTNNETLSLSGLAPGEYVLAVIGAQFATNDYEMQFTLDVPRQSDFDGNGSSDIVFRDTSTGKNTLMLMNGTTRIGWAALPTVATQWKLAGIADFDTDGDPDIIFRNTSNGENTIMLMDGTTRTGWSALPTISTDWTVGGTGDFDGDGDYDIVFRNKVNGKNTIMVLDGTQRLTYRALPTVVTQWAIGGVGDLNRDGDVDIIFRNQNNGSNTVMVMDGLQRETWSGLPRVTNNWAIGGIADFNADGQRDIFFRNQSNGENTVMRMNGLNRVGWSALPTVTTVWTARV